MLELLHFGHAKDCPYLQPAGLGLRDIDLSLIVTGAMAFTAASQQRINSIALSIQRKGQLQPIRVKKRSDGKYQVIDGTIRVFACRRLMRKTIYCNVV